MKPGVLIAMTIMTAMAIGAEERQLTFSPRGHHLDNNDNFSPDNRFLVFDTRETVGEGIGNGQSIEMVEIATGKETVLYKPEVSVTGSRPAPGVGAVTFNFVAPEVAFIHGPPVAELDARGPYGKPNRNGASVPADGSGRLTWLDLRDIATDRDTLPGAHRGGTHRHEFSMDGKRIGFTYDDFLRPEYDRTVGYMEPRDDAPAPATHYFALLVPVVPKGTAKPGEIEQAAGDSWVGRTAKMRAFIGKVRNEDGVTYEQSLFVVDIPDEVDITTADSGAADRYPSPPEGLHIRRLTHTWASGTVRGTPDGDRIAYLAKDAEDRTQLFVIPSDGSDRTPGKEPVQVTHFPEGVQGSLRWHPSANSLIALSDNGIFSVCVTPGVDFGKVVFLTPKGDGPGKDEKGPGERKDVVISHDGRSVAYGKVVSTKDASGKVVKSYSGEDFPQIFLVDFPDADGDGVADEG